MPRPFQQQAQVRAWLPSTRRTYEAAWRHFSHWCEEQGVSTQPASPCTVAKFLKELVEQQGRTLATARTYLAAIAAIYKRDAQPSPNESPLVRSTLKRLVRERGRPRRHAAPLTAEALALVQNTVRTPREYHNGRRWRERCETAKRRALVDLALIQVMRASGLRRAQAAALCWGNVLFLTGGSGRLLVARPKTDHIPKEAVLYLGLEAVEALLSIRPEVAVINPGASVFNLSASQINRRVKAATRMAGLGERFSSHSMKVGMDQDLRAAGAVEDGMKDMAGLLEKWQLDVDDVREQIYRAPTPRERERWHGLWLLGQGWSVTKVAEALERDSHTIGDWLSGFRRAGAQGLVFEPTGGSPPP